MKTLIITSTILLLTGTTIYYEIPKTETTLVSVMYDITSQQTAKPDVVNIMPLLGLSSNEWNGSVFRMQPITDVGMNEVKETNIEPENSWLSNSFDRDKSLNTYYSQVQQLISDSSHDAIGRAHSDIYVAIASELNYLSENTSNHKILLVYSDLEENLPDFSLYRKKDFNLLLQSPDKVQAYFLKKVSLNNLKGVEVHFLYQPNDLADDNLYRAISGVYRSMLERAGARVTITANLTN